MKIFCYEIEKINHGRIFKIDLNDLYIMLAVCEIYFCKTAYLKIRIKNKYRHILIKKLIKNILIRNIELKNKT